MGNKNFGSLTDNIAKLSNQISIGVPMSKAFDTFADDVGSLTVRRAVDLIKQAEMAGGKIDDILDSVASSIYQVEKLKKERAAAISSLVVQGYIIFFIFIGIMLVMQFKIIPLTEDVQTVGGIEGVGTGTLGSINIPSKTGFSSDDLSRPMLYMLLLQGIFSGLAIGKLSEGSIKAGMKHSFAMTIAAFLISTGANLFLQ
jgi:flagellar protein FlaJ